MVAMEMRCPRVAEWNVLKEMQDCDGRVQNLGRGWMDDLKEHGAGLRAYIYGLATRTRLRTCIKERGEVAPWRVLFYSW